MSVLGVIAALSTAQAQVSPESAGRELHIVFTGRTGGVSAGFVHLPEVEAIPRVLSGAGTRAVLKDHGPGALRRDGVYVFCARCGAGSERLIEALELSAQAELVSARHPYLRSPYSLVTQYPAAQRPDYLGAARTGLTGELPDLEAGTGRLFKAVSANGDTFLYLETADEAGAGSLKPEPSLIAWESKWLAVSAAGEGDSEARLFTIARFLGGGPKMTRAVQNLRRDLPAQAVITVDSGSAVEGFDRPDETLGESRDLSFSQLAALGYDVLTPGAPELMEGIELLLDRAERLQLPYVATNLRIEPGGEAEPVWPFPRWRIVERQGLRIAFLGVVSTGARARVGRRRLGLLKILDPAAAVRDALTALEAEEPDVALTVLLTDGDAMTMTALAPTLRGVDVVIGDFDAPDVLGPVRNYELAAGLRRRSRFRRPLLKTRGAGHKIGHLTVSWEPEGEYWSLRQLREESIAVDEELARDEGLRRRLKQKLVDALYGNEEVLLPDPSWRPHEGGDDAAARYSPEMFAHIVGNIARNAAGAHVAVIRRDPLLNNTAGQVSSYFVRSWTRYPERLLSGELTGDQLRKLASLAVEAFPLVFAGFDPAALAGRGQIGGRLLDSSRRYRVTLSDFVLEQPAVNALLGKVSWRPVGEGESLAQLVVRTLQEWRAFGTGVWRQNVEEASVSQAARELAGWFLRVDDLEVRGSLNSVNDNEGFDEVRENKVSSPSQRNVGVDFDSRLIYDAVGYTWLLRGELAYEAVWSRIDDRWELSETRDDVKAISELQFAGAKVSLPDDAEATLTPLVSVSLDSELTREEGRRRQRLVLFDAGIGLFSSASLKELRFAAQARWDTVSRGRQLDPGLTATAVHALPLPLGLVLDNELGITVLPLNKDVNDDLRLQVDARSALKIPLFEEGLYASVFAEYFGFRGRGPQTRDLWGQRITAGLSLGYNRSFDLSYGVDY